MPSFKPISRFLLAFAALAMGLFFNGGAMAQDTWNLGTSGTWDTSANWSSSAPPTSGTTAVFGNSNAAETITLVSSTDAALGLVISNTSAMTFSGAGTLSIGTGGLTINAGSGAVTMGPSSPGGIIVVTGSETWTNNSSTSVAVANAGGAASLTDSGSGPITLLVTGTGNGFTSRSHFVDPAGGVFSLIIDFNTGVAWNPSNGSNTYSGGTYLESGEISVNPFIQNEFGTGTIFLGGPISSGSISGNAEVFINGAGGTITNAITTQSGGLTIFAGNAASTYAFSGTTTLNNTFQLESVGTGNTSTLAFTGAITGTSGITLSQVAGTLIVNLTGTNTYSGATTINAGSLTISGAGSLGSGLYSGTISNAGTINYNSSVNQTLSGPISGGGALVFNSVGTTLTLSGSNTYSGGTTVTSGTLVSSGTSVDGALTLSGGVLSVTGSQSYTTLATTGSTSSVIALGTSGTLNITSSTKSFGLGSTLNLNDAAGGANGGALGTGVMLWSATTAGLVINGGFTVTDAGGTGFATDSGTNQVIRLVPSTLLPASGATAGVGYLVNDNTTSGGTGPGGNALTLTAAESANSITVDTTLSSGTLNLGGKTLSDDNWMFTATSGSNTYAITTGTLTSVASGDAMFFDNFNAGAVIISAPIVASGSNSVTFNGPGTTVLGGTNTYTGVTVINGGGTLAIGGAGQLASTGTYSGNISDGGVFNYGSTSNETLSGVISGTGAVVQSGSGVLTLSGANTNTGGLSILGGAVIAAVSNSTTVSGAAGPSTGAITLGAPSGSNSATLLAGAGLTVSNNINLGATSGTLTIGNNSGGTTSTFSGLIAGSNNLSIVNNFSNNLTISGTVANTGNLVIDANSSGQILITGSTGTIGAVTNSGTGSGLVTISSLVGPNVTTVTENGANSGLTFNNISTAGSYLVQSGTLTGAMNSTNPLGTGTITLGSAGNNAAVNTAHSVTFSNPIVTTSAAAGSLILTNASGGNPAFSGAITLNGSNTLTVVDAGLAETITLSGGVSGTGNLVINDNVATAQLITVQTGALNNVGTITNSGNAVGGSPTLISAVIGANVTGVIQNSLTSSLFLSGSDLYGGATNITSGTLQLGVGGATGSISAGSAVTDNGALVFDRSDSGLVVGSAISGAGNVVQTGTGATTLTGSDSYTGATIVNSGTLIVAGTLGGGSGGGTTITSAATFSESAAGVITGTSSLTSSVGTVTLLGANAYTGATTINSGTLVLGGGGSLAGTAVKIGSGSAALLQVNGNYTIGSSGSGSVALTSTTGSISLLDGTINTLTIDNTGGPGLILGGSNKISLETSGITSDSIVLGSGATASVTGTSTINIVDLGAFGSGTDVLISAPGGGLVTGGTFVLGTVSGITTLGSQTLVESDTAITLVDVTNPTPASAWFSGTLGSVWNATSGSGTSALSNFNTTQSGGVNTNQLPGATTNVSFFATSGSNLATTLGQNFTINSLTVAASGSAVSIGGTNTLTILATGTNGNTAGNGVTINSGAGPVTISAPVILGGSNTWTNSSSSLLTVSGGITGTANLVINDNSNGGSTLSTAIVNNVGTITNSGIGSGTTTITAAIGSNVTAITESATASILTVSGSLTVNGAGTTITEANSTNEILTVSGGVGGTGNLILNGNGSFTTGTGIFLGAVNNAGAIINSGSGSGGVTVFNGVIGPAVTGLIENSTNSNILLNAGNTFSGGLTVISGTVAVNTGASMGSGVILVGDTTSGATDVAALFFISGNYGGNMIVQAGTSGTAAIVNAEVLNIPIQGITLTGSVAVNNNVVFAATRSTGTRDETFSNTISGSNGTIFIGSATYSNAAQAVIFTGADTYTGATVVNNGILQIGNGSSGSISGSSAITVVGGATLEFFEANGSNQSNTIADAGTVSAIENTGATNTLSGVISGAGAFTQAGAGGAILSATETYTGATTVSSGTLTVTGLLSNSSSMTVAAGATLAFNEATGSNQTKAIADSGTVLGLESAGVTNTLSGVISGTGLFTQSGLGVTVLSSSNTYTGQTSINAGTVSVGIVATGTTAGQGLGRNTSVTLGVAGTSSGTLLYTGTANTLDKNITALGNGGDTIQNSGSGLLTLSGTLTKNGTTLTLNGGSSGITVSGRIVGSLANSDLIVTGGTTTLTNANTYVGATTIQSTGILAASGSGALGGTSTINVNAGGTLLVAGGTNSVANNTRFNQSAPVTVSGGTVAIQNGNDGVQETLGALTLSANSTVDFGSGSTNNSLTFASLNGGLPLSSGTTLTVLDWNGPIYAPGGTDSGASLQDRLLFAADPGLGTGVDANIAFYSGNTIATGFVGYGVEVSFGGEYEVAANAVPEPATIFGGLLLVGFVGYRERRRVKALYWRSRPVSR